MQRCPGVKFDFAVAVTFGDKLLLNYLPILSIRLLAVPLCLPHSISISGAILTEQSLDAPESPEILKQSSYCELSLRL